MGFYVKFWGTRGSIPTPGYSTQKYGGNTSCVEVRVDDQIYICDGGTGLRELGEDILRRQNHPKSFHMFFSHSHWDHIQGFPFFSPAYIPAYKLVVYGTDEGDSRIHDLLSGQMSSDYFPVDFSELQGQIVSDFIGKGGRELEGVKVDYFGQKHPGDSWAFSFVKDGSKVVYATDSEIDLLLPNKDKVNDNLDAPRQVPADLVEFVRGADLLVADGQYSDEEYRTKEGWGHPRATTVVDLALQANVSQLAIFHHDPMHTDDMVEKKIAQCQERVDRVGGKLRIFGAREGVELRLD
ncbi:MAG: MBL fold metallo-hydrolase [Myxococcales bacterium]|nr:MBL fold metallo-hydrolase [Myxococcales bacterium]|tara:strand:- start:991 stop:1875 length:885 start_codon:yes stop_codon:yes gene_type:complete